MDIRERPGQGKPLLTRRGDSYDNQKKARENIGSRQGNTIDKEQRQTKQIGWVALSYTVKNSRLS